MQIVRCAVAGTLESSDAYVRVEPAEALELEIESAVMAQYGQAIRQCVLDTLRALGVRGCKLSLRDRGALECVLQARVETAVRRATRGETA